MGDDDNNTLEEGNNQVDIEPKDTEDDEDDEEEVDETTNVRRKHNKRNPEAEQEAKLKAIARRKKRYNIQFTFDADVRCAITIYYFCTEEITAQVSFVFTSNVSLAENNDKDSLNLTLTTFFLI